MLSAALVAFSLLTPLSAPSSSPPKVVWAPIIASAADLLTTEALIAQRGLAGEKNPLMQSKIGRWGIKPLLTSFVVYKVISLDREGKRGKAVLLASATAVAWGGLALWNIQQLRTKP